MADTKRVACSDGISLSVREYGEPTHPTVLLIHGYPDTSEVWAGVVAELRDRFHVVTFDVRGAGASDRPKAVEAYRLEQLLSDIGRVIDAVTDQAKVHLIAHDWGSVQAWHAVTDPALQTRIASYTSISGPNLDFTGTWLRRKLRPSPRSLRDFLAQALHSAYIGLFLTPVLPELAWRSGVLNRIVGPDPSGSLADKIDGLKLYRANILKRFRSPAPQRTSVPVQVLAPSRDSYVGTALQTEAPVPYTDDLRVREIVGGHWVVSRRPELIARCAAELIDHVEGAPAERGLVAAAGRARQKSGTPLKTRQKSTPLAGRLAVITGAGGGIGRATALELARRGADIIIADVNLGAAEQTAQDVRALGNIGAAYHLDVADAAAFESFAKQIQAEHGTCDIVVNNAGIGMAGKFLGTGVADWSRIIDINLWGVIHGSRLFAAQMVERGEGGQIVNIASAAAYSPSITYPAYATTKAAVLMLTQCLRAELARDHIGATAICPGFINSDISRSTQHVGVDAARQEWLRKKAVKSYGRRNYTPARAAVHIADATITNPPIATITAESKAFLAMSRFTPALARQIAKVDLASL